MSDPVYPARVDAGVAYTWNYVAEVLGEDCTSVLEVGCGRGDLARLLESSGFEVVGIDPDRNAVRSVRRKGVKVFRAAWPCALERRFDAVLFTRSLHHVADLPGAIAAAEASLLRGGCLIAEEPLVGREDEGSLRWFRCRLLELRDNGQLKRSSPFLDQIAASGRNLVRRWRSLHGERHSSDRMAGEILGRFGHLETATASCLFRYLIPYVPRSAAFELLRAESRAIETGEILAFGRRWVARRSARTDLSGPLAVS